MILVVGAGIAGLSCALALAPFGDVVVAERRSSVAANAGAGIQLSPNAVKSLAAIGAREAVAARATAPLGLEVRAAGRPAPLVRLPYADMAARFGAPYLTAARADLAAALHEVVAAHPAITLRYDCAIETLTRSVDGLSVPALAMVADFVVIADGVGSALRRDTFGDGAQESADIAWRGTASGDGSPFTELTLTKGAHLVRYALAGERDNMVLIAGRQRHPRDFAAGPLGPAIDGVPTWTPWPIKMQRRARFHAGGQAVLVGDAAHAMPPFLAQGGAMAIEDAAVLGAAVATFGLSAEAASAYANARRERIRRIAAQTERQRAIYHLGSPAALARDAVMRRLGPRGILAQVGWIYGYDPPRRL